MSIPISALLILLALDGPLGHGIPPVVARFGGENMIAIPATFARHPSDSIPQAEIVWFLDGDTLAAPVAKSGFVTARTPVENPVLTHGSFQLDLPVSDKTVTYRGIVMNHSGEESGTPLATVQLAVFPPDNFSRDWTALAKSELPLTIIGELPGLREFLHKEGIRFTEGNLNDPSTLDRNAMVVVDASNEKNFTIPPGTFRAMLVFAPNDHSWLSAFAQQNPGGSVLWMQRPIALDFQQDPIAQGQFLQLAKPLTTKNP